LIAVGTAAGLLKCIDLRMSGLKTLAEKAVHKKRIRRLTSSPLKPLIFLSCSDDQTVALHSISKTESSEESASILEHIRLHHHTDYVSDICWSESIDGDEDEVFSSSYDGSYRRASVKL
jgi:WD40 repeat protein